MTGYPCCCGDKIEIGDCIFCTDGTAPPGILSLEISGVTKGPARDCDFQGDEGFGVGCDAYNALWIIRNPLADSTIIDHCRWEHEFVTRIPQQRTMEVIGTAPCFKIDGAQDLALDTKIEFQIQENRGTILFPLSDIENFHHACNDQTPRNPLGHDNAFTIYIVRLQFSGASKTGGIVWAQQSTGPDEDSDFDGQRQFLPGRRPPGSPPELNCVRDVTNEIVFECKHIVCVWDNQFGIADLDQQGGGSCEGHHEVIPPICNFDQAKVTVTL